MVSFGMASRNFCTSGSIFKCRDIVHIFTCRAHDKVTFTCTTARKFGHLGKMFSHLTFVSLSFFSAKDVSTSHFVSSYAVQLAFPFSNTEQEYPSISKKQCQA